MFFNDHNPPHFHMNFKGYNAFMEIETGQICGAFPPKAQKLALKWWRLHKEELYQNWNKMLERKPLDKIAPLKL